jgi:hypothetical protein
MRIYSNFIDYYDSVQFTTPAAKADPLDCVFTRKTSTEVFPMSAAASKEARKVDVFRYRNSLISFLPVFFCGKMYLIPKVNLIYDIRCQFFASFDKALEFVLSRKDTRDHQRDHSERFVSNVKKNAKDFEDFVVRSLGINDEFYVNARAPYFLISGVSTYHNHIVVVKNPNLQEIGFYKILDPFTAFQEIEMFFNSVLINKNDSPQITDDKVICEAKGFDKKISFRKRKA